MAKRKKGVPQREVTKRQLAGWQQQRKRQRIVGGLGILVIVAVLGVVGVGWYLSEYRPLHQTVIRVNDTEFNMGYYVKALEFHARGQPVQFIPFMIEQVEENIQQNELIKQGALELGFSVSDKEVKEELESHGPPFNDVHRSIVRTQVLISKLQDEYFEQTVPVFAEQGHILAMFLESESQVDEVRTRLESGEDFAALAGELSLDDFSKTNEGDLGWRPKGVLTELLGSSIPEEYAFSAEVGVLTQPLYDESKIRQVGYWLIKVLERKGDTEEAHLQAILLASEQQADEVRAKLEAGDDFGELAKEFSQHYASKEDAGDLGWLTSGMMSTSIDEFVFDPEVELGALSEPIRDDTMVTTGGYWLLKVVDIEDNRKIGDENRDLLKAKALNEWLLALWDDPENKVESYLDDQKKEWAVLRVAGS